MLKDKIEKEESRLDQGILIKAIEAAKFQVITGGIYDRYPKKSEVEILKPVDKRSIVTAIRYPREREVSLLIFDKKLKP